MLNCDVMYSSVGMYGSVTRVCQRPADHDDRDENGHSDYVLPVHRYDGQGYLTPKEKEK